MFKTIMTSFTLATLCTYAQAEALTVISVGGLNKDAQQQAFYTPFEKASGIAVRAGEYNGEMGKIKAMVDTGSVSWDVVEVDHEQVQRGCEEGLFERLPEIAGVTSANFVEGALNECGVGIFIWSTAFVYNPKLFTSAPTQWADFWNLDAFPGKRALRKSAKLTLEIALMADGVPTDQVYRELRQPEGVDRAFRKLDQIKSQIQWWEAGAQPMQWLAAGDVGMSSVYTARAVSAQRDGYDFPLVWKGNLSDMDSWAIVRGSPNVPAALKFIAFASLPSQQKLFAEQMHNGPAQKHTMELIAPEAQRNFPTAETNMAQALKVDSQFWIDYGDELEERFNAWAAH
ncbi:MULTISPECIES: ABC transporter substrate-binding protein [Pseudomonas]|uniref:ABC transporter substrate-binding protein n=1 Tax=Pseudomonas TaxID=286 RepID=UPI000D0035BB|nr:MULTISPECIES: ABC transporter substrate-binding protein [Pseudomonas]PRA49478.1 spermidine/putrescine ABC transporter substrate-binding protein [Pseudomonas sp. MYb115]QXN47540.1 ABC transporter substrate-binding protein [Pseudomonas fluorescens]WSO21840.1 ABC transporter substrate-binding protein [Pseudomonas fluorescens]